MIKNYFPLMILIISVIIFIVALKKPRFRDEIFAYRGLLSSSLNTIKNNFWPAVVLVCLPFMYYLFPGEDLEHTFPPASELKISYFISFSSNAWAMIMYPYDSSLLFTYLSLPVFTFFFLVKFKAIHTFTDAQNHTVLGWIRVYLILLFLILLGAACFFLYEYTTVFNFLKPAGKDTYAPLFGPGSLAMIFVYFTVLIAVFPFLILLGGGFFSFLTQWSTGELSRVHLRILWNSVLARLPAFIIFTLFASLFIVPSTLIQLLSSSWPFPELLLLIMEYYWYITLPLLPLFLLFPFFLINGNTGFWDSLTSFLSIPKNYIGKANLVILVPLLFLTMLSIGWDIFEYYFFDKSMVKSVLDFLYSILWYFTLVLSFVSIAHFYLQSKIAQRQ